MTFSKYKRGLSGSGRGGRFENRSSAGVSPFSSGLCGFSVTEYVPLLGSSGNKGEIVGGAYAVKTGPH
jgi:hypothetical protein